MSTRRGFVQAGFALGALSVSTGRFGKARAATPSVARYDKVLVDTRLTESIDFCQHAKSSCASIYEFAGDLTELWRDDLWRQWRQAVLPITGLTTPSSLLVLEQLGRDYGARVIFRAEHRRQASGELLHSVSGPTSLAEMSRSVQNDTWPGQMAGLVKLCPLEPNSQPGIASYCNSAGVDKLADSEPWLVTWAIAPLVRV